MAFDREQMNVLVEHAMNLEVGQTLPITLPDYENISTAIRYVHQAFQGLPNRKDFRISMQPRLNSIWIKRRDKTRGMALGMVAGSEGTGSYEIGTPRNLNPVTYQANGNSFAQQVGNIPKAYKKHLYSLADSRKLEGIGNPEETLSPILEAISSSEEITIILNRASTDLWIALGILSVEFSVPPLSPEELAKEKQTQLLRNDPFKFIGASSEKTLPRTDSNNETRLESPLPKEQSNEEYRKEMAEIFDDEGEDD